MYTNSKSRLVAATLLTATWLFGAAVIAQDSMMTHGMMESGPWFGLSGLWIGVSAITIVGAVLFGVLRRRP